MVILCSAKRATGNQDVTHSQPLWSAKLFGGCREGQTVTERRTGRTTTTNSNSPGAVSEVETFLQPLVCSELRVSSSTNITSYDIRLRDGDMMGGGGGGGVARACQCSCCSRLCKTPAWAAGVNRAHAAAPQRSLFPVLTLHRTHAQTHSIPAAEYTYIYTLYSIYKWMTFVE